MKYLKVTMVRGAAGEPAMKYPLPYDAQQVDRNKQGPIVYEGGFQYGEATEECLLYLTDALADAYAGASPDMEVISQAEADMWLAAARNLKQVPEERVSDPERLNAIKLKRDIGEPLSAEDFRALDPDDPLAGIVRRPKTARGIFGA